MDSNVYGRFTGGDSVRFNYVCFAESQVTIDGQVVDLPLNTILAQQFDIYKKRYETVSQEARYMAYLARLSIEQRIGMRLDGIDVAVGNLEAPSIWSDDI